MLISKPITHLIILSLITSVTNVLVTTSPAKAEITEEIFKADTTIGEPQAFTVSEQVDESLTVEQAEYTITILPPPPPPPPPVPKVTANPSLAQQYAWELVSARGWGEEEYACLVALWNKESGWKVNASNPSSGAYGIPQALPGNKMASAGADWQTNPRTQITWGLNYIQGRYGSPCGAWGFSQENNWY